MQHLSPADARALLDNAPDALFIDCRSEMEYLFVGHPQGAHNVPWNDGPDWEVNPHFVQAVKKLAGHASARPVLLICRSGNRSTAAARALEGAGFTTVYNVLHGFEGRPGPAAASQYPEWLAPRRAAVGTVLTTPLTRPHHEKRPLARASSYRGVADGAGISA